MKEKIREASPADFVRSGPLAHVTLQSHGDGWLIIGDALRYGDPVIGGGICAAMSCAKSASEAIAGAFATGTFSRRSLSSYAYWGRSERGFRYYLDTAIVTSMYSPKFVGANFRRISETPWLCQKLMGIMGGTLPSPEFMEMIDAALTIPAMLMSSAFGGSTRLNHLRNEPPW